MPNKSPYQAPAPAAQRPPSRHWPRLDVYSIRLFKAVAEEGSLARAAAREHLAASALSRRIADLEHALQASLIVRSARGITLTEAGRCVLASAERIEHDLQHLVQQVWALDGQIAGTIRLCANPSAIVGYLPERLRQFSDRYPQVSIELRELRSQQVLRACLDDQADLGIAVAVQTPNGLDSWTFAADPLVVVVPVDHPVADRKSLTFKDVLGIELVGIQPGGSLDRLMHAQAAAAGQNFKPRVNVESFDAACRMVQAGLGLAVLPTSAATAFAGSERFARLPLSEPWSARSLLLYALQKQPRPQAVKALIRMLRA